MKELSIEEKAQRFDEALIRCSRLWESDMITRENYEYIFPEVKESEDEEIKEMLKVAVERTPWMQDKKEKCYEWLEAQGEQKPADKVEPKFKVGDFIVNDFCMGRVVEITNDAYLLDTEQGITFSCNSTRLWDIAKDAKDGDVLVSSSGKPFIFKGFFDNDPMAYGGLVADDSFWPASNSNWTTVYCKPATKEQRNLLFQKMREAGYTFDFEKKELKEIEQKPTWKPSDEQIEMLENVRKILHADKDIYSKANNLMYNFEELIRTLKKLREK